MPSVSRDARHDLPRSAENSAIRVGAIAKPATNSSDAHRHSDRRRTAAAPSPGRAPAAPTRNRRIAGRAARRIAPVTHARRAGCPAPRARAAGRRSALCAVLVGERDGGHLGGAEQRRRARPRPTASGAEPRHGIGGRGAASRGRAGAPAARCARWAARTSVPDGAGDDARRRARPAGATVVASTVTRVGPMMKTASSTTASSGEGGLQLARRPASTCDQRARTHEPIGGHRRAGDGAARRCGHGAGQSACDGDHQQRPAATAKTDAVDGQHPRLAEPVEQPALRDRRPARWRSCTPPRPRRRGRRSRSRPVTSSTMPRVIIEIGSRATSPVARERRRAPGRPSTRR